MTTRTTATAVGGCCCCVAVEDSNGAQLALVVVSAHSRRWAPQLQLGWEASVHATSGRCRHVAAQASGARDASERGREGLKRSTQAGALSLHASAVLLTEASVNVTGPLECAAHNA